MIEPIRIIVRGEIEVQAEICPTCDARIYPSKILHDHQAEHVRYDKWLNQQIAVARKMLQGMKPLRYAP